MVKKLVTWISLSIIISVGAVLILFVFSNDMKRTRGSFLREFPPHPALEAQAANLKYGSYYLAGGTRHHIYLANSISPMHMVVVNTETMDTAHVRLTVKGIMDQKFWAVRIKVDSPNFYVSDGAVPRIFAGNVNTWFAERYPFDNAYFLNLEPINAQTFAIKALGRPFRENTLGKITSAFPHVQMKPGILVKQIDGVFCTDGILQYDKELTTIIYLHRYRNEYILLDTNLNVLHRRHTIDTTTRANIKVGVIESSGSQTLASPMRIVNRYSSVSNNFLFVNSMLVANNESLKAIEHSTTIDVYDLLKGTYQFSFYIYDFDNREKLRDFQVHSDKLYALFEKHVQVWNLSPQFFKK